ncbi:2-phosphosulfolactate phosphatase [Longispora albida]|uniref:2-phosphosulfolactate phosphatase n=1 Tax=Longispora albida TaxID=203523 RepID=UPI000399B84B|nr:2-phosphosulfolactate phosphatase [Longispora albida]
MAASPFSQPGSGVRFDWGLGGAAELGRVCSVLVVVDVLSFTTSVSVAVSRGMRVYPFPWDDASAQQFARRMGATIATGRTKATPAHPWSLSPAALASAPPVRDLVLPSPNGSAISAAAGASGVPVVAGCLRNAAAVARWLLRQGYGTADRPIGVIAAGERWPDATLRPSVEDLLGAAAILDGLVTAEGGLSLEAAVALAAYSALPDVPTAIRGSISAGQLRDMGFPRDVDIAAELNVTDVVPIIRHDAFIPAV